MKLYKHIVLHILVLVAFFLTAAPSFAEELSDDEASERVLTVCLQTVYPLWPLKEGRTFDEERYALTPPRLQKIAACMREKGVPAAFDAETQNIVLTGSGFGRNVDVKIGDLFPDDVTALEENPYRTKKDIRPDPDYSLPESRPSKRSPVRSGSTGVITGTENNKNGGSSDSKPIFLPR